MGARGRVTSTGKQVLATIGTYRNVTEGGTRAVPNGPITFRFLSSSLAPALVFNSLPHRTASSTCLCFPLKPPSADLDSTPQDRDRVFLPHQENASGWTLVQR